MGFSGRLESVSLSEHGFDVSRILWTFAKRTANLPDRCIDTVVGIEKDVFPPKALNDLIPADQSPAFPDEQDQQVRSLA